MRGSMAFLHLSFAFLLVVALGPLVLVSTVAVFAWGPLRTAYYTHQVNRRHR